MQTNNLKQIGLAFHNYVRTNDSFPAMATYGPDGLPTLSWRVALLPYLGEEALYRQFRQDEPWDSPHNKALAARMPAVFETPVSPRPRVRPGSEGSGARGPCSMARGAYGSRTSPTARRTPSWSPSPTSPPPGRSRANSPLSGPPPAGAGFPRSRGLSIRTGRRLGPLAALQEARLLPAIITRAGGEVIQWPPDAAAREHDDRRAGRDVAPDPSRRYLPQPAGRRGGPRAA